MARDAFGNIILFGGLAVGGYFLYQWFLTTPWASGIRTPPSQAQLPATTPPAPTAPAYQYTPASASQQLTDTAKSNGIIQAQGGQADAYQWATLYNGLTGVPSIANVNINSTFYPNGLGNQSANAGKPGFSSQGLPLITAQVFIQGITSAGVTGLSGLGQVRTIPVPVMLTPTSRFRMNLPAGTTPAELQRRLRAHGGRA